MVISCTLNQTVFLLPPLMPLKVESLALDFSTYIKQLLAFAGLTQPQYAVQVDARLWLVTVLNKAKGLKVEPRCLGKAVARHSRPLLH